MLCDLGEAGRDASGKRQMRDKLFTVSMTLLFILLLTFLLWGMVSMGDGCDDMPCTFTR